MIKLLFMDVDGTLTDGKIYMGEEGELCKVFDIKDGCGIHDILPKYGIVPVIITGRSSKIVENRAVELGIMEVYQGVRDKAALVLQIMEKYECSTHAVAYIGDDILDLPCIQLCGVSGCPSDAVYAVKSACDYICKLPGGKGAVREFIEWLIQRKQADV